jgi:hypothetical protein
MWSIGLAASYYAMVHHHGRSTTDMAADEVTFMLPELEW